MAHFMKTCLLKKLGKLKKKLEFHYTPKHASWLNMAEMEFSALARQCLDRRIPTMDKLESEALIWQEKRNKNQIKVNWSFTTEKARTKMKNRYNQINTQN
jgi:DDE superfamily endonuclease